MLLTVPAFIMLPSRKKKDPSEVQGMPSSNHEERKGEVKESIQQMHHSLTTGGRSLCCPFC